MRSECDFAHVPWMCIVFWCTQVTFTESYFIAQLYYTASYVIKGHESALFMTDQNISRGNGYSKVVIITRLLELQLYIVINLLT